FPTISSCKTTLTRTYHYFSHLFFTQGRPHRNLSLLFSPLLHARASSQELITTFLTSSSGKSVLTRTYHYFSHLFFTQERPHKNLSLLFSPLLHARPPSRELITTFLTSSSRKSVLTGTYHCFSHLFFTQEHPHKNLSLLFLSLLHARAPSQELITTFLTTSSCKSALTRTYHYFSHLFFTQERPHKNLPLFFSSLLHVRAPSQELTTTFLTSSSGKSALTRTYHYFSHLFFRQERSHKNLPMLFSPLLHVRAHSQELITTFLTSSSRKSALIRTYHCFSHLFFMQERSHKNLSLLFSPLLHARAPSQELTTVFHISSSRKNTLTGTHHRSSHFFLT